MRIRVSPDSRVYIVLVAVALVASAGFYSFPLSQIPQGTDSAVFTYIGEVIAGGGMPYVDVFDHKGPLVYLLNAFGAAGPSTWLLWLVEWSSLSATLCLGYRIGRVVGAPALAAAVACVLLVPFIIFRAEGGNMTEEYGLPFMLACMLVCARVVKGMPLRTRDVVVTGACAACLFMLRFPQLAGVAPYLLLAFALVWVKRGALRALGKLGLFAVGFALACAPVAAWLAHGGALRAFAEQYFAFNRAYASDSGGTSRWETLRYFAQDPAVLLALVATGAALALCWAYRDRRCGREMALVLANLAGLALLFVVAVAPGRSYGHYFLMFAPLLLVALNAAVLQVNRAASNRAPLAVLGAVIGLGLLYAPASYGAVHEAAYRSTLADSRAEAVAAIRSASAGGDVLVVGNECWVYLDGGFRAPVPYAYRSDSLLGQYDAWLDALLAGPDAPGAIAVADYVPLGNPLAGYAWVADAGGFSVYAREGSPVQGPSAPA